MTKLIVSILLSESISSILSAIYSTPAAAICFEISGDILSSLASYKRGRMVTFGLGETNITLMLSSLLACEITRIAEIEAQKPAKPEPAITILAVIVEFLRRLI
ncbi:hypothetical protein; putative exported protein [Xenorhabdus nematophila ATCC 19061]|uniref:Uncharacterized protein n=1 Tax=Xenorhabdus nematophila (strain ATCC 19061 / DSM 3370 / CCUG 14189 / LMG 1036 / NCIMB 9965 / AN6) TaxID=406817 RepID=D3VFN3_XENNA|nr:hypothetical protein; putative exported protein [Xenorhabdus nematophila ATCC 19061]